jgi:hypothetical protein
MQDQPSTLTTAFVTGVGSTLAPAVVAYLKTKGIDLSSPSLEQALGGFVTVAIGTATPWVVAILGSLVGAVVALNNGLANLAGRLGNITIGKSKPAAPAGPEAVAAPKQAGFARLSFVLLLLAVMSMFLGCSSLGLAPATSTADQVVYAVSLHDGLVKSTANALASGSITAAQADEVAGYLDKTQVGLNASNLALSGCPTATVQGVVQAPASPGSTIQVAALAVQTISCNKATTPLQQLQLVSVVLNQLAVYYQTVGK